MDEDYYSSQQTPENSPPQDTNQYGQPPIPEKPKASPMATASMVMGILSIVFTCCCCGGIIFGSLGILFALLSRNGQPIEGRAKAGLITGCIGIGLTVVLTIVLIIVEVASSSAPSFPNLNTLFITGLGGV